jgi:hypothetical protein
LGGAPCTLQAFLFAILPACICFAALLFSGVVLAWA